MDSVVNWVILVSALALIAFSLVAQAQSAADERIFRYECAQAGGNALMISRNRLECFVDDKIVELPSFKGR